jgi:hypothetical protein
MKMRFVIIAAALVLAACGQQDQQKQSGAEITEAEEAGEQNPAPSSLPPVDPLLLGAANTEFSAIEPSEVGVFGAPTVMQALEPLLGPEVSEGASLHLSVRETGDEATADIVRAGMADDSVSAGHVRLEFRHEEDGWYPTNAYRRSQCARGGQAGQWTSGLCP